jgi:branched-chain amino acid transport system substrate-binding protein
MNRKFLIKGLAVICASSFIAAACGDDSSTTSTNASSPAGETTVAGTDTSDATATTVADLLGPENKATGEPLKIGFFDDGKGADVDNSDDHVVAFAARDYINNHLGGIAGRPIEFVHCEDENIVDKAIDCGNQFVEQKVNAVLLSTSGQSGDLFKVVNAGNIPFFCGGCAVPEQVGDPKKLSFILVNGLAQSHAFPTGVAKAAGVKQIASLVIDYPAATEPMVNAIAAAKAAGIAFEYVAVKPDAADMTPEVTAALSKKPGLVHIIGDPVFCLKALTALNDLKYDGIIQTADYCVNAKTYEPLPAELKTKLVVAGSVAMGLPAGVDKDWDLYQAIMKKYATKEPIVSGVRGWAYQTVWALYLGTKGIDPATITGQTIADAMHAAPAQPIPLGAGITFKCDGSAFPPGPAFCTASALQTSLDAAGNFTSYKAVDTAAEVKAIGEFLLSGKKTP